MLGPTMLPRAVTPSFWFFCGTREGMDLALLGPCWPKLLLPKPFAGLDGSGAEERGAEERRGVLTRQAAGAEIAGADGDRFTPVA